jgi:hypothetical protein
MHQKANGEDRNSLLLLGGTALILIGAGLVLAHPGVRKTLGEVLSPLLPDLRGHLGDGIAGLLPDVERYLRLRAM